MESRVRGPIVLATSLHRASSLVVSFHLAWSVEAQGKGNNPPIIDVQYSNPFALPQEVDWEESDDAKQAQTMKMRILKKKVVKRFVRTREERNNFRINLNST